MNEDQLRSELTQYQYAISQLGEDVDVFCDIDVHAYAQHIAAGNTLNYDAEPTWRDYAEAFKRIAYEDPGAAAFSIHAPRIIPHEDNTGTPIKAIAWRFNSSHRVMLLDSNDKITHRTDGWRDFDALIGVLALTWPGIPLYRVADDNTKKHIKLNMRWAQLESKNVQSYKS